MNFYICIQLYSFYNIIYHYKELPWWSDSKEFACNAEDPGSAPESGRFSGSGRFPGEGNGNPTQYSCLENPMDRGAWQVTAHGFAELPLTD